MIKCVYIEGEGIEWEYVWMHMRERGMCKKL